MKVLIISANAFSKVYNNGKTLESIFKDFYPQELAQLFTRPQDSKFTDYNFCNDYYVVSEMDIINRLRGKSKKCGGKLIEKSTHYQSTVYNRFKRSSIKKKGIIRECLWALGLWKTRELDNWIESIDADIIFLVGGGSNYLHSIATYVSKKLSIPLTVFYTDDYLIYPVFKGITGKLRQSFMKWHYSKIIKLSSKRFAIGKMMSKEYEKFFKKDFIPIMNSVPVEKYTSPQYPKNSTISYFGGLHLNRWKMLSRFARLLPSDWQLLIYSSSELSEEIKDAFNHPNILFKGCVTGKELKEKMRGSQVLLHVESDDAKNRALTRLSVSTKIPEYLMTGRTVIGFGPQEVASMHVLTDNNIGIGLDSDLSDNNIRDILSSLLSNTDELENIGKRGHLYAVENHNGEKIYKQFRETIEDVIQKSFN